MGIYCNSNGMACGKSITSQERELHDRWYLNIAKSRDSRGIVGMNVYNVVALEQALEDTGHKLEIGSRKKPLQMMEFYQKDAASREIFVGCI